MDLRATNSDQAAASDRGADIHVCRVDIRVDVRLRRVLNGAVLRVFQQPLGRQCAPDPHAFSRQPDFIHFCVAHPEWAVI